MLYLIIYNLTLGSIGGVVGPLPYDLFECQYRAGEPQARADEKRVPLKFTCEFHDKRPEVPHD